MRKPDIVRKLEIAVVEAHEDVGDAARDALAHLETFGFGVAVPADGGQHFKEVGPAVPGDFNGVGFGGVGDTLVGFIAGENNEIGAVFRDVMLALLLGQIRGGRAKINNGICFHTKYNEIIVSRHDESFLYKACIIHFWKGNKSGYWEHQGLDKWIAEINDFSLERAELRFQKVKKWAEALGFFLS